MTLWVETYRPQKIDDVILPAAMKKVFTDIIASGEMPNMILSGGAGIGKTTIARALCDEMGADMLFINGSDERNIDILRNKIRQFASTVSFGGGMKVVIIDEADYLNANSTQPALRGFMEQYSKSCRFILTCNFKNRIIDPLHSRCSVHEFALQKKDLPQLAMALFNRLKYILDEEGVTYDDKALVGLVQKHAPDWRRVINTCQTYAKSGTIDLGVLADINEETFNTLTKALKEKNFKDVRKWVANNMDVEPATIFRRLYDTASAKIEPTSIPQLVLTLGEWQYKSSLVMDQEINTVACMTEIMSSGIQWK